MYEAQVRELERWMEANGGAHPDRALMAVRTGHEEFALSHLDIVGTDNGHNAVMQWTALANAIPETILDSRFDQIN